jgi:hypothetical protein
LDRKEDERNLVEAMEAVEDEHEKRAALVFNEQ